MAASELVKTFDLTRVRMIVGGQPISGFQDGDALVIEFDEDTYSKVRGADGEIGRSRMNSDSASFTFNVQYGSLANAIFQQMADDDRDSNTGIRSLLIEDTLGGMTLTCAQVWVRKRPDVTLGKEMPTCEWILDGGKTN